MGPDIQERTLSGVPTGLYFYLSNMEVLFMSSINVYSVINEFSKFSLNQGFLEQNGKQKLLQGTQIKPETFDFFNALRQN